MRLVHWSMSSESHCSIKELTLYPDIDAKVVERCHDLTDVVRDSGLEHGERTRRYARRQRGSHTQCHLHTTLVESFDYCLKAANGCDIIFQNTPSYIIAGLQLRPGL